MRRGRVDPRDTGLYRKKCPDFGIDEETGVPGYDPNSPECLSCAQQDTKMYDSCRVMCGYEDAPPPEIIPAKSKEELSDHPPKPVVEIIAEFIESGVPFTVKQVYQACLDDPTRKFTKSPKTPTMAHIYTSLQILRKLNCLGKEGQKHYQTPWFAEMLETVRQSVVETEMLDTWDSEFTEEET